MKVGDKVKRISTQKYNDIIGTVVELQGTGAFVQWGGDRVSGPNQPYLIPQSDLLVVQSLPAPPSDDNGGGGNGGNGGIGKKETDELTPQTKSSKTPVIAGIAIAALLLLRGAK
jgi:hypothetical protein